MAIDGIISSSLITWHIYRYDSMSQKCECLYGGRVLQPDLVGALRPVQEKDSVARGLAQVTPGVDIDVEDLLALREN